MTYAAVMGLGLEVVGTVTAVSSVARGKARDVAVTQLGPTGGDVFDMVDDITHGADPQTLLRTRGVTSVRQLLSSNSAEFEKTTGVSAAAVDALLQGIQTGDAKTAAMKSASILGGAIGTAACGPPCGMVVSMIATGVVQAVDNFLHTWVLGDWDDAGRRLNEKAVQQSAQALVNLTQMTKQYSAMEDGLVAASQVAAARTYNDLLSLGVTLNVDQIVQAVYDTYKAWGADQAKFAPPWSRKPSMFRGYVYDGGYTPDMTRRADAASKFATQEQSIIDQTRRNYGSIDAFQTENDQLRPEDTVLLAVRKAFVDAVKVATDAKYAGLWDRNKQESGFYDMIEHWKVAPVVPNTVPGVGTDPRQAPPGETPDKLFCTWADPGMNPYKYGQPQSSQDSPATCQDVYAAAGSGFSPNDWSAPGWMAKALVNTCFPSDCGEMSELAHPGHHDFCFGGVATFRAWLCHYPRHFKWMADNAPYYAQQWSRAAVRDISVLQMTDALRKAKTASTIAAATAIAAAKLRNFPVSIQAASAHLAANQAVQAHVSTWAQIRNTMMGKNWTPTGKAIAIGGVGVLAAVAIVFLLPD